MQAAKPVTLPSTRPDADRDNAIKDAIRGPIFAMTAIGMMGDREKKEAWGFWIEALRPYPQDWIRDAFAWFARNGGSKYPNPQRIIEIINKRKGGNYGKA